MTDLTVYPFSLLDTGIWPWKTNTHQSFSFNKTRIEF